jgi:hypothetical protein
MFSAGQNKIQKFVFLLDEARFTVHVNRTAKITDVGIRKIPMLFMSLNCSEFMPNYRAHIFLRKFQPLH